MVRLSLTHCCNCRPDVLITCVGSPLWVWECWQAFRGEECYCDNRGTKWKGLLWKRWGGWVEHGGGTVPLDPRRSLETHTSRGCFQLRSPAVLCVIAEQNRDIFLGASFQVWWGAMKTLFSPGDRFPMLAIKPCYFQLAGTGNEIRPARLTCGGKISSRSATGQQAAPHTCNVLRCPRSPRGRLRPAEDMSHCHPLPHRPLVQLSSSNRLLMKPNEARGGRGKLLQLHHGAKKNVFHNKSMLQSCITLKADWLTEW